MSDSQTCVHHCGQANDPDADFCSKCREPLVTTPAPPQHPPEALAPEVAELRCTTSNGRFDLYPGCVVGRGSDADIDLSSVPEHQYISRRHASFLLEDGRWWLQCLEPSNDTRLNGRRVTPSQKVPLAGGDTISLGEVVFLFRPRLRPNG